ncbi:MAG: ABC transporter permease [Lachnospiraceae bacterium]
MDLLITIVEQGLIYGILALGVYITYKILDFPDLTVDGSFPLGAAITAAMITRGVNPYLTLLISCMAGVTAGICTGLIHVKCKVRDLLSGIIMMTALWTINLRIAGTANVPLFSTETIFKNQMLTKYVPEGFKKYTTLFMILILVLISKCLMDTYLKTKSGFLLRAVGDNDILVTSLAKDSGNVKILGLAIANGLVALAGSIFCQEQRVFEISSGTGAIVIGLASVIIGTSIFKNLTIMKATTAVLVGSIMYKGCVAVALRSFEPQDMKLITAILFLIILVISMDRRKKVKNNAKAGIKGNS